MALERFDAFPGPVYAVDSDGWLAYYNQACVGLAGRTPQLGIDRWCVCAKLLSADGEPLDPAIGSMADALRNGVAVRGIEAIVERADGERTRVRAYPTAALDAKGKVRGAINMLVPLDGTIHRALIATALRCKNLARWIDDRQASESLTALAAESELHAEVLRPA